jgi:hypothetical protein
MLHAPGHVKQHVLPLGVPVLQQPLLPLDVSVQQQHLLPLDLLLPALKQTFSSCLCLLYSSLRCIWTRLFYNSLCCMCCLWTCVSSTAACAFPGRVCVSVLQQPVLSPEVSGLIQQQPMLRQEEYGLQQLVLHLQYTVCLQEPMLHLDVSIYTGFCAAPGVSVCNSFVLHMDMSAY